MTGLTLIAGLRLYSKTRASLSPWGFQAALRSKGPCVERVVLSVWTRYVNATADLDDIGDRSIVNSSGFSPETGLMNVLFGPMASKFGKLLMRIVS